MVPSAVVAETAVPRTVLALYDSTYTLTPRDTHIHAMAEMPLNHLGVKVKYWNIRKGLPGARDLADVRGVLTWFESSQMAEPERYIDWAVGVIASGRKFVVLADFGCLYDAKKRPTPPEKMNRLLKALGLRNDGNWTRNTYDVRVVAKTARLFDFERSLSGVLPPFEQVRVVDPMAKAHLRLVRGAGEVADVVAIGPCCAFVAAGYTHYSDESGKQTQWYLNPFEFFRDAFQTDDLPKLDVTTLSGRRIYYSHIDGDGWRNLSEVQKFKRKGENCAQSVWKDAIEPYPDLPVSVAPIAADLDPEWKGSPRLMEQARAIFALPQVEAATHTYTHPLDWGFFENYSRAAEKAKGASGKGAPGYDIARAYDKEPFDIVHELQGSIDFINKLCPPGKTVKLVQWSGNTLPFRRAIQAAREAGLRNINGGDTRFDGEFPSYSWVAPVGREAGGEWQVYSSNSNENTYTDLWTTKYFGYQHLVKTARNTESPIRVKPFNVYYHFYSGEKLPSLNALKTNLDYARTQELAPVAASEYAAIADGFWTGRLVLVSKDQWRIEDRDGLDTLRFDNASGREVDFDRSTGVIGQRLHQGSLYVALDRAVKAPVVALLRVKKREALRAWLVHARWRIWNFEESGSGFRFVAQGFGAGEMIWKVPTAGTWEVLRGAKTLQSATVSADHLLRLTLAIAAYGPTPLEIRRKVP